MNSLDHSLERLLKAAAQAPRAALEPASFARETQVLAEWRSTRKEDEFALLVGLFRRAVIFASLIMTLSVTWNYLEKRGEAASTVALASYALKMQLPP